jgi:hypothetical protein
MPFDKLRTGEKIKSKCKRIIRLSGYQKIRSVDAAPDDARWISGKQDIRKTAQLP